MKIAITTTGTELASPLDSRFGRTKYFLIYDSEAGTTSSVDNVQNLNAPQGAGIQAAMHVAQSGAQVVLTGHCGPKAFRVLQEAGIQIFLTSAATAQEAVELYQQGKLAAAENPDVAGHWA